MRPFSPKARLLLRELENRIAPAAFTVTTTSDVVNSTDGVLSLREALIAANASVGVADTINFDPTIFGTPQTITLTNGPLPISDSVTISGPGAALLTISGNNTSRVITVDGPGVLTAGLSGMTLTGGRAIGSGKGGQGGAIYSNDERLTLTDSVITGNTASSGGAIYIYAYGTLTAQRCTISANSAGVGGGIYLYGNAPAALSLNQCTLANNTATTGEGGGAFISFTAAVTINGSTVADNSSVFAGGGLDGYNGTLTITNTTFSGNRSTRSAGGSYGGGDGGGGGIYFHFAPTTTIQNSTFSGNLAIGPDTVWLANGGAFCIAYASADHPILIQNSTIANNSATSAGGGLWVANNNVTITITSSVISGNTATDDPAQDIFYSGGAVAATYSAIGTAAGYSLAASSGHNIPGGTPLNLGPLQLNGGPTVTQEPHAGSPLIDAGSNPASLVYDQRGFPRVVGPAPDIGAVESFTPVPIATLNAALTDVTAPGGTSDTVQVTYMSAVAIAVGSLGTGDVRVTGPNGFNVLADFVGVDLPTDGSPRVATYQFTPPGGSWDGLDDGTYSVAVELHRVADISGAQAVATLLGTFQVATPLSLVVTNINDSGPGSLRDAIAQTNKIVANSPTAITFSNNTANGAINFYDGTTYSINLQTALPTILNGLNITGPGSAMLTIQRSATATPNFRVFNFDAPGSQTDALSGMTIRGGNAVYGGGIETLSGALTLNDVAVTNNTSTAFGGGIYMLGSGTLTLTNSNVFNNTTANSGGAIFSSADVTIRNSTLTNNQATLNGGAIDNSGSKTLTITNSTIANNNAKFGGGMYSNAVSSLTVADSCLFGNSANTSAGAIYFSGSGTANIVDSTVANNTVGGTSGSGGGILLSGFNGTMSVNSSTITGNTANSTSPTAGFGGGGIAFTSGTGSVNLDNTIVSGNASVNGYSDIAAVGSSTITTSYSAINNTTGFTYTPGPGNLPIGANLNLQPLANNGGPTQTIAFAANSPLLNAGDPALANTTDQRGVPRTIGPAPDIGAYEYQPITVANVQVNDGSAQRSEVRSIAVTFSGPVTFAGGNVAAAFQLKHVQTGNNVILGAITSTNATGQTVVTLTFSGAETDAVSALNGGVPSLADGRYQLTVLGSAVTDAALGWSLDGNGDGLPGGNYVSPAETNAGPGLHLYRLFADATGDGTVDASDLGQLRTTYNSGTGNPAYLAFLDADNSGAVDSQDFGQFRSRFNASVF